MSIQKLQRVMWRLRHKYPGKAAVSNNALMLAIMQECGTSPITYTQNRSALKKLGWIKASGPNYVMFTDVDISGEYT
jgi:hypothetical protein